MVALDKQFFHHHGTKPRSCGRWRDESWQTGKSAERRTADILSARRPRDTSSSSNTSCANEIIYCGYQFDPESQLYYVRNRTYSPVLGRWIQRDPLGYKDGANLYGYVGGGVIGLVDADGAMGSRPKPITMAFPPPTGNSGNDAQEYLDLLKDKGKEIAEEFLKEAAKQYADNGDSDSLANALDQLAKTAGKAFSKALTAAGDAALKKGLESLSKDLGKEVGALQQGLAALAGDLYCRNWYTQTYKDIEAARRGHRAGCNLINSNSNTNFSGCYGALLASSFDAYPLAMAFRQLAKALAQKCNACPAPPEKKRGG